MIILKYQPKFNNDKPIKYDLPGFTLIEVLISVVLFSAIILSVTGLFKLSIDSQREAIAVQNVQESLKYFLEVMAKEIRMAQRDDGVCPAVANDKIFFVSNNGNALFFKNYYGECVGYKMVQDGNNLSRFEVSRQLFPGEQKIGFLSPAKIRIDQLNFNVRDNEYDRQPLVTISIKATALSDRASNPEIVLQTSVSSRYYK